MYFDMAKEWPEDEEYMIEQARRLLRNAMWNLSMVRNIDAWNGETND